MSYQSMKVSELKDELKKRGLPFTGKKDDLVQRLLASKKGKDGDEDTNDETQKDADNAEPEPEVESDKKGKGKRKAEDNSIPSNKIQKSSGEDDTILDYLTDPEWKEALTGEFSKPYFKEIVKFVDSELASGKEVFPPKNEIFSALNYTPIDKVRCVILGQDPYHDNNQANGLCFSVRDNIKHPPSLRNIFKELETDVPGFKTPKSGSLEKWAHSGVLLLNATLTVEAHHANSHAKCGWMKFTDAIIEVLNKKAKGVVFILWGGFAQKKGKIIDKKKHFVIEAAHPSPLSQKLFFGCKVFSQTNEILKKEKLDPIDWTL